VLNIGEAGPVQTVIEESSKLLGVVSFLMGHFAAFAGALEDIEKSLIRNNALG
jgi:hypothetical protein